MTRAIPERVDVASVDIMTLSLDQLYLVGWPRVPTSFKVAQYKNVVHNPGPPMDFLSDANTRLLTKAVRETADRYKEASLSVTPVMLRRELLNEFVKTMHCPFTTPPKRKKRRNTGQTPPMTYDAVSRLRVFVDGSTPHKDITREKVALAVAAHVAEGENKPEAFVDLLIETVAEAVEGNGAAQPNVVFWLIAALFASCEHSPEVLTKFVVGLLDVATSGACLSKPSPFVIKILLPVMHLLPSLRVLSTHAKEIIGLVCKLASMLPSEEVTGPPATTTFVERFNIDSAAALNPSSNWEVVLALPYAQRVVVSTVVMRGCGVSVHHVPASADAATELTALGETPLELTGGFLRIFSTRTEAGSSFTGNIEAYNQMSVMAGWQLELRHTVALAVIELSNALLSLRPTNTPSFAKLVPCLRGGPIKEDDKQIEAKRDLAMKILEGSQEIADLCKNMRMGHESTRNFVAILVYFSSEEPAQAVGFARKNLHLFGEKNCRTDVARWLLHHVSPPTGNGQSRLELVENIVHVLVNATVPQLQQCIQERSATAAAHIKGLDALLQVAAHKLLPASELHRLVQPLNGFLWHGCYTDVVMGCGSEAEDIVRGKAQALLHTLFRLVRGVLSGSSVGRAAHHYVSDMIPNGAFVLSAFSILTGSFDAKDYSFIQTQISAYLLDLMPNNDLSRTPSFCVEDGEETDAMASWQAIVELGSIDTCDKPNSLQISTSATTKDGLASATTNSGAVAAKEPWKSTTDAEPVLYYEVKFHAFCESAYVGLAPTEIAPGLGSVARAIPNSAFLSSTGRVIVGETSVTCCPFHPGDVIGVGMVNRNAKREVFFTRNGELLMRLPWSSSEGPITADVLPCAGWHKDAGALLQFTFQKPFAFDPRSLHPTATHAPTPHTLAFFATRVFHILMVRSVTAVDAGLAMGSDVFFERGCAMLLSNAQTFLSIIEDAAPIVANTDRGSTERVKAVMIDRVCRSALANHLCTFHAVLHHCTTQIHIDAFLLFARIAELPFLSQTLRTTAQQLLTLLFPMVSPKDVGQEGTDAARNFVEMLWKTCTSLSRKDCVELLDYDPRWDPSLSSSSLQINGVSANTTKRKTHLSAIASPPLPTRNIVEFSVVVKRSSRRDGKALGNLYYIGVVSTAFMSRNHQDAHPELYRSQKDCVWALTDGDSPGTFLPHGSQRGVKLSANKVAFGSGDKVTVSLNRSEATLSFTRNDEPLGIIFRDMPRDVDLYPYVMLFNDDASVTIEKGKPTVVYTIGSSDKVRYAKYAAASLRAMLCAENWTDFVDPQRFFFDNSTAHAGLEILGSDGDAFRVLVGGKESKVLAFTPSGVHIKGDDDTPLCLPYTAMEQTMDFPECIASLLVKNPKLAAQIVEEIVKFLKEHCACADNSVCILGPNVVSRCLRVLREIAHVAPSATLPFASDIHGLCLSLTSSAPCPSSTPLLTSFVNAVGAEDPDEEVLDVPTEKLPTVGDTTSMQLVCPRCEGDWKEEVCPATKERHTLPTFMTEYFHWRMLHKGLASDPFSLSGSWLGPRGVTMRLRFLGESIAGEGKDNRGDYTVAGTLQGTSVQLTLTYSATEVPAVAEESAAADAEWPCEVCTFINSSDAGRCAMCTSPRPGAVWACAQCTYAFNSVDVARCEMCASQRGGERSKKPAKDQFQIVCSGGCGSTQDIDDVVSFNATQDCAKCGGKTTWLLGKSFTATINGTVQRSGDTIQGTFLLDGSFSPTKLTAVKSVSHMRGALKLNDSPLPTDMIVPLPNLTSAESKTGSDSTPMKPLHICIVRYAQTLLLQMLRALKPQPKELFNALVHVSDLSATELSSLITLTGEDAATFVSIICFVLRSTNEKTNIVVVKTALNLLAHLTNAFPAVVQKHTLDILHSFAIMGQFAPNAAINELSTILCSVVANYSGPPHVLRRGMLDAFIRRATHTEAGLKLAVTARIKGFDLVLTPSVEALRVYLSAIDRMNSRKPLTATFDRVVEPSADLSTARDVQVEPLPNSEIGDDGKLIIGQIKSSVGVNPRSKRKYYYEVIVPDGGTEVRMGWGTATHEIKNPSMHVGTDTNSWAYNLKQTVFLHGEQHEYPPPQFVAPGNIVGAMLDCEKDEIEWSLNGVPLGALPLPNSSETLYAYVSANCGASRSGVRVIFDKPHFLPSGYTDLCDGATKALELLNEDADSTVPPMGYTFYRSLTQMLDELGVNGMYCGSILSGNDAFDAAARSLFASFPQLREVCGKGDSLEPEKLLPYIRHLHTFSTIAPLAIAKVEDLKGTPLWETHLQAKYLLLHSARWSFVEHKLRSVLRGGNPIEVTVDRADVPTDTAATRENLAAIKKTIFGQLFTALHEKPNSFFHNPMFRVVFKGSISEDRGGLYRSTWSLVAEELMPVLPHSPEPLNGLFTYNTQHSNYKNIVPTRERTSKMDLTMYRFLGKVFGNAVVTGAMVFAIDFPRAVWKFLVGDTLTIEDYYFDICDSMRLGLEDELFLLDDETFFDTIPDVRTYVEQLRGDAEQGSQPEAVLRAKAAKEALIHMYDTQLLALQEGFQTVVPSAALTDMTWMDVHRRVCGCAVLTATEMLAAMDITDVPEPHQEYLTSAIGDMTDAQRGRLLLFCTGQSRLPIPEVVKVVMGDEPKTFPTSHSCSPITLRIHPYQDKAELWNKLLEAMAHAHEYGFV